VLNLIVKRFKSNRKIIPFEDCVTKFHCIFEADAADVKRDGVRGFILGINLDEIFIPVSKDVTIEYKWWSLLKDNGFRFLPDFNKFDPLKDVI
jgi:hypothetical protein